MQQKVSCVYYNSGKCEHGSKRIFGLFIRRQECEFSADNFTTCPVSEAILEKYASFDPVKHGPTIDPDGREWEICKVTRETVVIRIRDPYDSAVNEVSVRRDVILSPLGPTIAAK
jgi:hypothetical protein